MREFERKKKIGRQIADEEARKAFAADPNHQAHNDIYDATRHARWSQRMATAIGPLFSLGAGVQHEADNIWSAGRKHGLRGLEEVLPESAMDMHNNTVGLQAGLTGRPINPRLLQTNP